MKQTSGTDSLIFGGCEGGEVGGELKKYDVTSCILRVFQSAGLWLIFGEGSYPVDGCP